MLLQFLEVSDERDGVEPVVRPEKLLPSDASDPYTVTFLWLPVYGMLILFPLWRSVFSAGHGIVYEKRLVLHDHDESFLF